MKPGVGDGPAYGILNLLSTVTGLASTSRLLLPTFGLSA